MLEKRFYVIAVSYDGFDETEDTVFPDMITEAEKIEAYIRENFGGRLFAAYGCSLGGSFVGLIVQRGNIYIEHGFIGSFDLDQSGKIKAKLMTKLFGGMIGDMNVIQAKGGHFTAVADPDNAAAIAELL